MLIPRTVVWIFSFGSMVLGADVASGQDYPNKPIRIVTSIPGGTGDVVARLIAPRLSGSFGQRLIVDNRPSGVIPAEIVAKATPDGYTLLFYTTALWITPLLQKTPYDPVRDFSPITLAASSPNVLVVHPSVAANSVKELIALAKARPGELNYGTSGVGTSAHIAAELFKAMAGVNFVHVPYKGSGLVILALLGNEVQVNFAPAAAVAPHMKSSKVRALAVTSAQPSALLPGLPTVAASGLLGYETVNSVGILAPAKTPAAIINRLNQEIARVLNQAEVKEKFFGIGLEVAPSSPEQFAALIKSEITRISKVIQDAGIRAN
ncbi:MAG: tripartite tricarboxylate transporter substrate binding protein [Betaproteobacteria bacterium]|nr:tripartite tricarboxylate transporter substrate binding protein [Betaproteobacteria bacterium]